MFCAQIRVVISFGLRCMHMYSQEYYTLDYISLRVRSLQIFNFLSFQCLARCLSNSICLSLFQCKVLTFLQKKFLLQCKSFTFFLFKSSHIDWCPATELTDGIVHNARQHRIWNVKNCLHIINGLSQALVDKIVTVA